MEIHHQLMQLRAALASMCPFYTLCSRERDQQKMINKPPVAAGFLSELGCQRGKERFQKLHKRTGCLHSADFSLVRRSSPSFTRPSQLLSLERMIHQTLCTNTPPSQGFSKGQKDNIHCDSSPHFPVNHINNSKHMFSLRDCRRAGQPYMEAYCFWILVRIERNLADRTQ